VTTGSKISWGIFWASILVTFALLLLTLSKVGDNCFAINQNKAIISKLVFVRLADPDTSAADRVILEKIQKDIQQENCKPVP